MVWPASLFAHWLATKDVENALRGILVTCMEPPLAIRLVGPIIIQTQNTSRT